MIESFQILTEKSIAENLGVSYDEVLTYLKIKEFQNLSYKTINGVDKEKLMLSIFLLIDNENLRKSGENNNAIWEKAWGETLHNVKTEPSFSMSLLAPKYFEKHKILRYCGQYIQTDSPQFLYEYDKIIRQVIFSKYLAKHKHIVEIGCGTGNSQMLLSKICTPITKFIAADWSTLSQKLLTILAKELNIDLTPVNFNMLTLEGANNLNINNETAILTVHSLEQLADNYKPLLNFLLKSSPDICVHIEPIKEFYKTDTLFDYIAIKYHEKRNYLGNWLTELHLLEKKGEVKIIEQRRLGFGDRHHEAYNLVVWKPINN